MRVSVALLGGAVAALYGSYSYFAPSTHRPAQLADLTQDHSPPPPAAATSGRQASTDERQSSRVFSPQAPLLPATSGEPAQRGATDRTVREIPTTSRRSDPFGEPPVIQAVQSKNAARVGVASPAPVVARKSGATRAASEETRAILVRDLQRELKRVGCYDGEITGAWGQTTRRAMTDFTDRVNASLPVDEPDYILLALVQGHASQACGACPPGQLSTNAGRCQPRAITAQGDKRPLIDHDAQTAEAPTRAPPTSDADRRTAWLPKAEGESRLDQRAAGMAGQLAAAPLPGRMSIGAPVQPGAPAAYGGANGWQTGTVTAALTDDQAVAGKAPPRVGKSSATRRGSARQDYYSPPRAAYAGRATSPRPRSGSLRTAQGVRDFFFGPNRNSY